MQLVVLSIHARFIFPDRGRTRAFPDFDPILSAAVVVEEIEIFGVVASTPVADCFSNAGAVRRCHLQFMVGD